MIDTLHAVNNIFPFGGFCPEYGLAEPVHEPFDAMFNRGPFRGPH
jgi:hypothetical protein